MAKARLEESHSQGPLESVKPGQRPICLGLRVIHPTIWFLNPYSDPYFAFSFYFLIPTPGTKLRAQFVLAKLPENKWTRHYKWQDCSLLRSLAPVPRKVSKEDQVLFKGIKPKQPLEKNALTS